VPRENKKRGNRAEVHKRIAIVVGQLIRRRLGVVRWLLLASLGLGDRAFALSARFIARERFINAAHGRCDEIGLQPCHLTTLLSFEPESKGKGTSAISIRAGG
jgi:hypothetical protein